MVVLDDENLRDRGLLLRRWGRRSEVQLYGTRTGERDFWEEVDGIRYDNMFIFDELGWNFEPSELSAAFGEVQLRKLPQNLAARQRNFARLSAGFAQWPEAFELPRTLDGLDTAWHMFPLLIRDDGLVTEGSFTNIFAQKNGRLVTPPLRLGLLSGVLRRALIEEGKVEEGELRVADLAGGFFIGNATRGLMAAQLIQSEPEDS